MANTARAIATMLGVCVVLIVAVGTLQPRSAGPSPFAYAVAPESAVEVTRLQLEAGTEQLRIQTEHDAQIARERTVRLGIIGAAVVLTLISSVILLGLVRRPPRQVIVLLPADPMFNRALHDMGGVRINGVPQIAGRVVDYIEVEQDN
jgi:hypothetical protein